MDFFGVDPRKGDAARPLLLLLHGFGSSERDLPAIVSSLPDRFDWVSLRGPLSTPNGGFAWSPPVVHPASPDPESVRAGAAAILDWIDEHAAGRTIVPLGFSQGGVMVTELLRARPDVFPAGVVLAAFASLDDRAGDAEFAARRIPVYFGWGEADDIIPQSRFRESGAWLAERTAMVERVYPGLRHSISAEMLADVSAFLDEAVPAGA